MRGSEARAIIAQAAFRLVPRKACDRGVGRACPNVGEGVEIGSVDGGGQVEPRCVEMGHIGFEPGTALFPGQGAQILVALQQQIVPRGIQ